MSIQTLICTEQLKGKIKGAVMLSGGGIRKPFFAITKPNHRYWKKLEKDAGAKSFEEFKAMSAQQIWEPWRTKHMFGKAMETKIVFECRINR